MADGWQSDGSLMSEWLSKRMGKSTYEQPLDTQRQRLKGLSSAGKEISLLGDLTTVALRLSCFDARMSQLHRAKVSPDITFFHCSQYGGQREKELSAWCYPV